MLLDAAQRGRAALANQRGMPVELGDPPGEHENALPSADPSDANRHQRGRPPNGQACQSERISDHCQMTAKVT
jgi:hypothetical protein